MLATERYTPGAARNSVAQSYSNVFETRTGVERDVFILEGVGSGLGLRDIITVQRCT